MVEQKAVKSGLTKVAQTVDKKADQRVVSSDAQTAAARAGNWADRWAPQQAVWMAA